MTRIVSALLSLLFACAAPVEPDDPTPVPGKADDRAGELEADEPALSEEPAFDHSAWDGIVATHVTEDGWVDYEAIRDDRAAELQGYLDGLADAELVELGRDEQMAFWINAYNAICIRTLIDHGLPDEVPHAWVFGANIFTEKTYVVAGEVRSLDDIEHRILRTRFSDPRVHAALVCGASSCPRLRPRAYDGATLDEALDEEARRWVAVGLDGNGERKNVLDRERNTLWLSKIFSWFEEDFGGGDEGVLEFVSKFSSEEDREYLATHDVRIRHLDYDWTRNGR